MKNLQILGLNDLSDKDYYSKMTEQEKELYKKCSNACTHTFIINNIKNLLNKNDDDNDDDS